MIFERLPWDIKKNIFNYYVYPTHDEMTKKYLYSKLFRLEYNWIFDFANKKIRFFCYDDIIKYIEMLKIDGHNLQLKNDNNYFMKIQKHIIQIEFNFIDYVLYNIKKLDNNFLIIKNEIDLDDNEDLDYGFSIHHLNKRDIDLEQFERFYSFFRTFIIESERYISFTGARIFGVILENREKTTKILLTIFTDTNLINESFL